MKIENQVPLKDTCLKLQAIGIEFDSYFYWQHITKSINYSPYWEVDKFIPVVTDTRKYHPAPMVPELLEKLPVTIGGKKIHHLTISPKKDGYKYVHYVSPYTGSSFTEHPFIKLENLAQALSEMLIWLKEKSYI